MCNYGLCGMKFFSIYFVVLRRFFFYNVSLLEFVVISSLRPSVYLSIFNSNRNMHAVISLFIYYSKHVEIIYIQWKHITSNWR